MRRATLQPGLWRLLAWLLTSWQISKNACHGLLTQLHALSEVNETLTVRLLELEERVALLDQKLVPGQQEIPEGDRVLLAAADLRIERISGMLEPTPIRPKAEVLPISETMYEDEPEQLFMDEAA